MLILFQWLVYKFNCEMGPYKGICEYDLSIIICIPLVHLSKGFFNQAITKGIFPPIFYFFIFYLKETLKFKIWMTLNPIKIITNLGWMHEDHYFLAFKKVPKKRGGEVGTIPWKQMSRSYLEQWWSKSQQLFLGDDLPQHPREKKYERGMEIEIGI